MANIGKSEFPSLRKMLVRIYIMRGLFFLRKGNTVLLIFIILFYNLGLHDLMHKYSFYLCIKVIQKYIFMYETAVYIELYF